MLHILKLKYRYFHKQTLKQVTINVLKFDTLFSFCSNKILVITAGVHKMVVRIANREGSDQTASEE